MKLGISNLAWNPDKDKDVYALMQKYNYTSLEIAPAKSFSNQTPDDLLRLTNAYGLKVETMQAILYGESKRIFESSLSMGYYLNQLEKVFRLAKIINCTTLVFGSPSLRSYFPSQDEIQPEVFFKKLSEVAKSYNVRIALEPNPIIYNTNFLNTTQEAFDFVKKINCTNLGINLDIGTILYNQEKLDELMDTNNTQLIFHVHVSEPNLIKIQKNVLHRELFSLLAKCRYQDVVSIEMKSGQSMHEIEQTLGYIKEVKDLYTDEY